MSHPIVVDQSIWEVRPDYATLAVEIHGLKNAPSDAESRSWLDCATRHNHSNTERLTAWEEAFRAVGMKPNRFRPSNVALTRRCASGLPAINRIVDAYNSVSVKYGLPIGGEDLAKYSGTARLTRAIGGEPFDTVEDEQLVTVLVEPDEVIWRDDIGVTCRRWSWRQCVRTQITESTTDVLFVLERLAPMPLDQLEAAGNEICSLLGAAPASRTLITAP